MGNTEQINLLMDDMSRLIHENRKMLSEKHGVEIVDIYIGKIIINNSIEIDRSRSGISISFNNPHSCYDRP